ncbi:MAG: serine/threonine protein kinase [Deltaproteobacteria bacterium]|nr:serine/threonine protein kinase [Deltaproteobacteria bacterium]
MKRVLPAFSDDDEFISRFQREAKLAAQLRHTNIVGVIDFGEVGGVHYMTLELVDGIDLRSLLKSSPGGRLSPDTVALIGLDLAYALEHAHRSLIHRDISPSNILLSRSGETKLADFGIAKAIDNAAVTASRSAKGKIPYMSPEHMRGESVDGRTDLFSLGVVLFEAVARVRPFDGAHDIETMRKILDGHRLSLSDAAPEVPAPLREVIERLITVDLDARTPSATRLIEELAAVAPLPQVRRRLASTVEGHRGGPKARLHVRAREEERDTELSRPPALGRSTAEQAVASAPQRMAPKRGRAVMLASAVLALLITVAAVLVSAPGTESVPESASVPVSESESVSVSVPVSPGEADTSERPQGAAAPSPASVGKGWIHVVVQPWGDVWFGEKYMGRAPVKAPLSQGRHVIKAGRDFPIQTRVVRIEAGAHQEIEFSLED